MAMLLKLEEHKFTDFVKYVFYISSLSATLYSISLNIICKLVKNSLSLTGVVGIDCSIQISLNGQTIQIETDSPTLQNIQYSFGIICNEQLCDISHLSGIQLASNFTLKRRNNPSALFDGESVLRLYISSAPGEEITLTIIALHYRQHPFQIQISREATGSQLMERIIRQFASRNWLTEDIRILFRGRLLIEDHQLKNVDGLRTGDEVHVVYSNIPLQVPPEITVRSTTLPEESRLRIQSLVRQQQRSLRGRPYNHAQTRVRNRFNNCLILHRNFAACVDASIQGTNPPDRIRFNDPVEHSPDEPTAVDLGQHVRQLSQTVYKWALELNRLSNRLLIDGEVAEDTAEKETFRRLVQNNMDAARYFHPHLLNLTKFQIPLNMDAPRQLFTANSNQPEQFNQQQRD